MKSYMPVDARILRSSGTTREATADTAHANYEPVNPIGAGKRRDHRLLTVVAIGMMLFVGAAVCCAQQIAGTLVGTVQDAQGASVQNAKITVTNIETGIVRTTVSNEQGDYRVEYLHIGKYKVAVEAQGFKQFLQKNVTILVDQTQRVDAALAVGDITETVTVSSAPPLINTSTAEIGRTLEMEEITGTPLPNRNVYTQLSLTPGVVSSSSSGANGASMNSVLGVPSQQTIINGGFDNGNGTVSYYLDGGINMTSVRNYGNPAPNPDALQEFRVETNNYSAQYGRYGAGVVTVVTRSGVNKFHGSLFEFDRNTVFNDLGWRSPINPLTNKALNPPYHRNQFGGTIGGPIVHDKSFFFFSYGGLRQITNGLLTGAVVPTALERLGDFTQSASIPNMPGTSTPVKGTNSSSNCQTATVGCIPSSSFDPTAMNILNAYVPAPLNGIGTNTKGAQNGWAGYFPSPYRNNEILVKIDHQLSPTNHLSGSFFQIKSTTTTNPSGNLLWSKQIAAATQDVVNISDTKVFNSGLINQSWFTFTRSVGGRVDSSMPSLDGKPYTDLSSFGSNFTIQGPTALPQIAVSGYFTLGDGIQGPKAGTDFYSLRDVASKTIGKHSLDFGAEMSLDKDVQITDLYNYGVFSFATSAPNTTKNALADFLTGNPATMVQSSPDEAITNAWYYAFFLQDSYRVTPRLTMNLGLRYDFQTPPTDNPQDRESTFVPGVQSTVIPNAPLGMLFVGDKGVTRGTVTMKFHHVAPRIGLAFDPFGDGKFSIRAAGGIFYGAVSGNEWNATSNFAPFSLNQTYAQIQSLTNVYGNKASFPTGDPFPYFYTPKNPQIPANSNIEGAALSFQWPYSYQFNLSVQRQLPGDSSVTVAYVGALSHDVPTQIDVNYDAWAPGASTSVASENARHPYDQGLLNQIQLTTSNQTLNYHSLQISASKRMSKNFSMNGFYVLGHGIWSASPANAGNSDTPQNFGTMVGEKSDTDTDRRHTANISGIWDISYFKGSQKWVGAILNGWQISPIVSFTSGSAISLLTGADKNADQYASDRPNAIAGVRQTLDPHRARADAAAQWFNTAAFQANGPGVPGGIGLGAGTPTGGADGNVSHNTLRGPGSRNVDLGIFRTVNTWEGVKLQFRAEASNAFNMVNLSNPGISGPQTINPTTGAVTAASSSFGKITSAGTPRQIQVGARLTF